MLHQIPQVNITDPPVVEITLPLPPHPPRLVTEYIVIYIIIIYLYYISHTVFPRLVTDYIVIYIIIILYYIPHTIFPRLVTDYIVIYIIIIYLYYIIYHILYFLD